MKAAGNFDAIQDLKEKRNVVKKMMKMYTNRYNVLKERLGYESEFCSSATSDDDDDEGDWADSNNMID